MAAGRMTREELLDAIRQEAIETVLVAMPDWYGRLLGKRLGGPRRASSGDRAWRRRDQPSETSPTGPASTPRPPRVR